MSLLKKTVFLLTSGLLIFFLINRIFFFKKGFLENLTNTVNYPIIKITSSIANPIKNVFEKRKNLKELKVELEALKDINENLFLDNLKLKETIKQYNLSSDLRDFQSRYNLENKILAKILFKNISPEEHSFLINKGSKDGIKLNMVAIYKFQIIGKVVEVNSYFSKILLITDKRSKVSVFTNNTGTVGIAIGKNKINSFKMDYVSHLSKVEGQDLIISSGQGLIFLKDFV